ncbi:MAG: LuxR C-terminal-related transcriptional regulator [Thermomicrobiales bacterium]
MIEPLSPRELQILALLGKRDSNKEIAARLFISPATVKRHTVSIYRKLDVSDTGAAQWPARSNSACCRRCKSPREMLRTPECALANPQG